MKKIIISNKILIFLMYMLIMSVLLFALVSIIDINNIATAESFTASVAENGYQFKITDGNGNFVGYINSDQCNNPYNCICVSSTPVTLYDYDEFDLLTL